MECNEIIGIIVGIIICICVFVAGICITYLIACKYDKSLNDVTYGEDKPTWIIKTKRKPKY